MKKYSGQAPFSEFWSSKRSAEFRTKGFGTINIGSRVSIENPVSREIDRIIFERLIRNQSKDS